MLVVYWLVSLLSYSGNCLQIPVPHTYNDQLSKCVTDIVAQYFTARKVLTYVGNENEEEGIIQAVHIKNAVSLTSRRSSTKLILPHEGYLLSPRNVTYFVERFPNITRESTWNPEARFLIILRELEISELKVIFDTLLKAHVINVVVVNSTDEAHLYAYNPFDNYGCGKHYESITSYGKCSQALSFNLYPEKIVTGLRNCTLNILVPNWPPYAIIPKNDSDKSSVLRFGAETYLVQLIGEMQGFNSNIVFDYDFVDTDFATVSYDMEAVGALKKLQNNEADFVFGGMLLTPVRASGFSYVFGHLSYVDEIKFLVKKASLVHLWKNLYLQFEPTVWVLLMFTLILYSVLMTILLRTKDKSYVVLRLFDNLILHGHNIKCRLSVKCVLIIWIWFCYLVNTFYTSNLVSLMTNPAREYQISNEEDIAKFHLKPCFSTFMLKYHTESQADNLYQVVDDCQGLMNSVKVLIESKDVYTIIMNGIYQYNDQDFLDEYGEAQIVLLKEPYSKVIYSIYFYKGFPLVDNLRLNALQLRENGLVNKVMNDMNYQNQIKRKFRGKEYRARFTVPWRVYVVGCVVSGITFAIEVMCKHK